MELLATVSRKYKTNLSVSHTACKQKVSKCTPAHTHCTSYKKGGQPPKVAIVLQQNQAYILGASPHTPSIVAHIIDMFLTCIEYN